MPVVEHDEYKGNKMIVLKETAESKFGFRFGKRKARLIMECLDEVKKFAEED